MAAGKVAFHFPQSDIYLLGNDNNDDLESKSAKELLHFSGVYDTRSSRKSKNLSGVIVRAMLFFIPSINHLVLTIMYF